jgi:hypothetical protein
VQIHPRMTSSGRRWAALFGIALAFALPKRVERGTHRNDRHELCTASEIEPFGFYLIERAVGREVGFAYSTSEDCR